MTMSSAHRIGTIAVDEERAAADLAAAEPFGYLTAYDEFVCGSWRTCMLWNADGDAADTRIQDYEGAAQVTPYGAKVGYVRELLERSFHVEHLRFARLARLGPGSVVVPHRDFLELEDALTRIHVPLETGPECYTSQESTIYRMGIGEIWSIDATRPHSIANFSDANRTHLLLDFEGDPEQVLRAPVSGDEDIPDDAVVPRRPLWEGEREAFARLSEIVDPLNFRDILSMIIRRYFVAEMEVGDVFECAVEIAQESGNEDVLAQSRWLEQHSLVVR